MADDDLATGHDVHFLSRLERVNLPQMDTALRLYRDPSLVKEILGDSAVGLATAAAGGATARVAIAIADGPSPPHVLVESNGRFVTCLGPGMGLDEVAVLPWERLTVHLRRVDARAERDSRFDEALKDQRGTQRLMSRLFQAGTGLTREEVAQLCAIAEPMQSEYFRWGIEQYQQVCEAGPQVVRLRRVRSMDEPLLRSFWKGFHAFGHLATLFAVGGRQSLERWSEIGAKEGIEPFTACYVPSVRRSPWPIAVRSLWAIGRAGKLALPFLKRALGEAEDRSAWLATLLSLMAVAFRHQRLRAEVASAISLARLPSTIRDSEHGPGLIETLRELLRGIDEPTVARMRADLHGWARRTIESRDELEADRSDEERDERAQRLLVPLLANLPFDHYRPEDFDVIFTALVLTSRATAEELYFPEADSSFFATRFSHDGAIALSRYWKPRGPRVRTEEKVGRNDRCGCGSGKKSKRCCGL